MKKVNWFAAVVAALPLAVLYISMFAAKVNVTEYMVSLWVASIDAFKKLGEVALTTLGMGIQAAIQFVGLSSIYLAMGLTLVLLLYAGVLWLCAKKFTLDFNWTLFKFSVAVAAAVSSLHLAIVGTTVLNWPILATSAIPVVVALLFIFFLPRKSEKPA